MDKQDQVFVFNRRNRPHAVHLAPDETIWCADDAAHVIHRCTLAGKVLFTRGTPDIPAPEFSGRPFNRPTQTALTPNGDILVADGYGNARVHKYAPDGRWLMSWGEFDTDPGQFNVVHNITCGDDGFVYIADRENYRIQVFDIAGKFVTQWHNLFYPSGMYMHDAHEPIFFVGELGPFLAINRRLPNIGPRISILDHKGQLLGRLGAPHAGTEDGTFIALHTLAMDSRGDLYVGEVSYSAWDHVFPGAARPRRIRSLQKLVRVNRRGQSDVGGRFVPLRPPNVAADCKGREETPHEGRQAGS